MCVVASAVLGGAAILGGSTAYAASKSKVTPPPARNPAEEGTEMLEAQIASAPDVFAARSSQEYGDPAYARLQMQMLEEHAPQFRAMAARDASAQRDSDMADRERFAPRIREMSAADASAQRTADTADLSRLGPQVTEAWRRANPQQAALLDAMHARAMGDLERRGQLDPSEMRQAEQGARASWDARGRVRSSGGASAEILNRYGMQQQRNAAAMNQAAGVAGLQSQVMQDPSMAILGRSSMVNTGQQQFQPGTVNTGQQQFQPGQAFNPFDPYGAQLYGQNSQQAYGARMQTSQNRMGLAGGIMSIGGDIMGAGIGGGS